jgi:hypothetical protein
MQMILVYMQSLAFIMPAFLRDQWGSGEWFQVIEPLMLLLN